MNFIRDLNHDEMRSGFLVTSQRKKLWNVMLGCYNEFRRVCEKYNIRFFASHGTLLGAVRHRGFIPWDDDMDFVMFRPDYEKFKEVARNEIHYPYKFDVWYENEHIKSFEDESPMLVGVNALIISNETTTVVFNRDIPPQGIGIDIFPLDSRPISWDLNQKFNDDDIDRRCVNWLILRDLFYGCLNRKMVLDVLQHPNMQHMVRKDQLTQFLNLPLKIRGEILERHALSFYYEESEYVSNALFSFDGSQIHHGRFKRKSFRDIIYLPFENTSMPCPIGFDEYLSELYGDWHELKITHSHAKMFSADISYKDFLKMRDDRLN